MISTKSPYSRTLLFLFLVFELAFAGLVYYFIIKDVNISIAVKVITSLIFFSATIVGASLLIWGRIAQKESRETLRGLVELRKLFENVLSKTDFNEQVELFIYFLERFFPIQKIIFAEKLNNEKINLIFNGKEFDPEIIKQEIYNEDSKFTKHSLKINNRNFFVLYLAGRELNEIEKALLANFMKFMHKILEDTERIHAKEAELSKKIEVNEKYRELFNFTSEIQEGWTYEDTYWKIALLAKKLFNADSVSVIDVKEETQKDWHFVAFKDVDNEAAKIVEERFKIKTFGENLRVVKATKTMNYIQDTSTFPGWISSNKSPSSWLGIPLLLDDEVVAIVNLDKNITDGFSKDEIEFARAFSVNISMIMQKNHLLFQFKNFSITDPLTGLYNRREFDERLKREIENVKRNKWPLVLFELDLDKFKSLNDKFGHPTGDKLLKAFAKVLKDSTRGSADTLFRIGGDEFALILPNTKLEDAKEVANRIYERTKEITLPIDFSPSVSIGIADYKDENFHDFIDRVDKALYKAKNKRTERVFVS